MKRLIFIIIIFAINPLNELKNKLYFEAEYNGYKNHFKWLTKELFKKAQYYSNKNKIDTSLTLSIIWSESRGHWWAKGKPVKIKNKIFRAKGLMQVMDFHYKGDPSELFNPDLNLYLGTKYLNYCLRLANNDMRTALKNYNSGPNSKYYNKKYIKEIINNYILLNYNKMISFKNNGLDWS